MRIDIKRIAYALICQAVDNNFRQYSVSERESNLVKVKYQLETELGLVKPQDDE